MSSPDCTLLTMRINKRTPDQPEWVSLTAICDALDIHRSTLAKWRTRGLFPPAKKLPNGRVVVRRDDFEAWMNDLPDAT